LTIEFGQKSKCFRQHSKFWWKFQIIIKFGQNSKVWSKFRSLVKIPNFGQNSKNWSKFKILVKIANSVRDLSLGNFIPNLAFRAIFSIFFPDFLRRISLLEDKLSTNILRKKKNYHVTCALSSKFFFENSKKKQLGRIFVFRASICSNLLCPFCATDFVLLGNISVTNTFEILIFWNLWRRFSTKLDILIIFQTTSFIPF